MTLPKNDLLAIGVLAQQLQQPVHTIEAAVMALNMLPAMRLNFVPHFSAEQVERIAARLAEAKNGNPLPTMYHPKNLNYRFSLPSVGRL